ncbi:hypothetical protein DM02DRAFT_674345 [Periconia macrospinosa]|uniref:Apple domain-containing protein n=1 Tax=Periconia macrospinosa TaxID=97972 RepID=A0A2V1DGC3_9PLEO|nr:hypothetical protein DM02DRAFT_674345 [Periconia macrospinosa]
MKLSSIILSAATAVIIGFTASQPTTAHIADKEPIGLCIPLPEGHAPTPGPPTTHAFVTFPKYSELAINAAKPDNVPKNYQAQFYNASGATLYPSAYIIHFEMTSYNATECAEACNAVANEACRGFNTYIERAPTKVPGPACPNPDPTYRFVCALYSDVLGLKNTDNEGGLVEGFEVLERGSNGYIRGL